jgi:HAD superfamily hydrolase (TIGR01490 family)
MNLALFDFDGTITSSDTWTPFMRFAVPPARLIAGQVLLAPVFVGHRMGVISSSTGRQMATRLGFQGVPSAAVRQLGVQYATTMIPKAVRRTALERMEWHRRQADQVVIVSASLDVYLGPWCEARGLDVICTTLEEQDGKLTGRCVRGDCCGREKVRRITERYDLTRYLRVYAYGDSGEDREMLELAHKKFYRWREVSSWDEVTAYGHPTSSKPFRRRRAGVDGGRRGVGAGEA